MLKILYYLLLLSANELAFGKILLHFFELDLHNPVTLDLFFVFLY